MASTRPVTTPTPPPHRTLRSAAVLLAALASWLASGCGSTPTAPVVEELDGRTGVTITRLARPLELVATEARGAGADPFAAVAPFETNVMGRKTRWLWIAFPGTPDAGGSPAHAVLADGQPLSIVAAGSDPESVSLKAFPYEPSAPWAVVRVFALDAAAVARLAGARRVALAVDYPDGRTTFATSLTAPSPLAEFASRTADPR